MKTILHIGSEKTGSTSIQAALWSNREALRATGVLVPDWSHPVLRGHVIKVLFKGIQDTRIDKHDPFYQGSPDALAFAWREWNTLEKAFLKFKPHTLILSTELLFSPIDHQAEAIIDRLKRVSSSIEVVAYVREPNRFAISSASQEFKNNVVVVTQNVAQKLAYRQVVSSYEKMFDAPVTVLEYDRRKLVGGSIVEDFFTKVVKTAPSQVPTNKEWNISPSPEMLTILQDLFVKLSKTQRWNLGSFDFKLIELLLMIDKRHASQPKKLTPMVERWIEDCFTDREWLAAEFGIHFAPVAVDGKLAGTAPLPDEMTLEDTFVLDPARQEALRKDLRQNHPKIWHMLQNSAQGRLYRIEYKTKARLRALKSRIRQLRKRN